MGKIQIRRIGICRDLGCLGDQHPKIWSMWCPETAGLPPVKVPTASMH